ncbi:hypothetical protein [Litorihabitans aurantiacus]|uniref:Uncharacterized protein n=1 Tax=Litorihabitans aurantiacus TaxID=1930061 RepID=A0AA37UNF9_9MICO|nr:hypothetical protein [Litorihabitans aurantiacus]GMA30161.1 hypothetical protein GCM10025875_01530 [Litorihabitans aurantiacus]
MRDPGGLLLGLAVLLAVVVGGLRMARAAVLRGGGDRRSIALDTDVGLERRAWARERGWQYVPGPVAVATDGLEPPGTLPPVQATHVVVGAFEGRRTVIATRSGERVPQGGGRTIDWRTPSVRLELRSDGVSRPHPTVLLLHGAQDTTGALPALVRRRELATVRAPQGLPWLVATPAGVSADVLAVLDGVFRSDVPRGVAVLVDGDGVAVAVPGSGARSQVTGLIRLAQRVAEAVERLD